MSVSVGAPNITRRPAVFLDRDGTLMIDTEFPRDPAHVRLLDGAAEALRILRDSGFALVVVSNQSGIGRGIITPRQFRDVEAEFVRQMIACGVTFDGLYHCPLAPDADPTTPGYDDRKPGPGMLRRAAADLNLSLPDSWMIGDRLSDVLAGANAGCRGSILVATGKPMADEDKHHPAVIYSAADIADAARYILDHV